MNVLGRSVQQHSGEQELVGCGFMKDGIGIGVGVRMWSASRQVLLLAAGLSILAACTTKLEQVHVPSVATAKIPDGSVFQYYLPKLTYIAQVSYTLVKCPSDGDLEGLSVDQNVTIEETSVRDQAQLYFLTYETLSSALKTTNFKATNYDDQVLHTVGASADDKTADTIKNLASSGINIAKLVAGSPASISSRSTMFSIQEDTAPESKVICRSEIAERLEKIAVAKKRLRGELLSKKEREQIAASLDAMLQSVTLKSKVSLDPIRDNPGSLQASRALSKEKLSEWFEETQLAPELVKALGDAGFTSTTLKLIPSTITVEHSPLYNPAEGAGIYYREPVPATLNACAGTCGDDSVVARANTLIPQLAGFRVLTFKNGPFKSNNISLSFARNGSLSEIQYGQEASAPKVTGLLSDVSGQGVTFQKFLDERAAARDARELNSLKSEIDLLTAKADLIEARRRLLSLQQGEPEGPDAEE